MGVKSGVLATPSSGSRTLFAKWHSTGYGSDISVITSDVSGLNPGIIDARMRSKSPILS